MPGIRTPIKPLRIVFLCAAIALVLVVMVTWGIRLFGEARLERARERFETEIGSLSLSDYLLPELSDEANAAVWLRRGAEALELTRVQSDAVKDILTPELWEVSPEAVTAAAAVIDGNQRVLDLVTRAERLESSTFDFDYERGFEAALPPMVELVRVASLLGADLRLSLLAGESTRVRRDLALLGQLTEALARESFLISVLIHLGVERQYLAGIRDLVGHGLADLELLSWAREQQSRHDCAAAVRRAIAGEVAAMLALSGQRQAEGVQATTGERKRLGLLEPYRLAALLDAYRDLARSLDDAVKSPADDDSAAVTGIVWSPHEIILPNLRDAIDKVRATRLGRRLAGESLALRLVSLESGSYPAGLNEPIADNYAGGTVVYERRTEGGALLSASDAIARWDAEHGTQPGGPWRLFSWDLPPLRAVGSPSTDRSP